MKVLQTLLVGCGLSAMLVASAAALTPVSATPVPATPMNNVVGDDFGLLTELAGSCWKVDSLQAVEICYWFETGGRTLNARQYVDGRLLLESSIATSSSRPGWLLETSRWMASPYTVVNFLRIEPTSGRVFREPVRPIRDERREVVRHDAGWIVETIRMIDANRFELVRNSGREEGFGRSRSLGETRWTFTRSAS